MVRRLIKICGLCEPDTAEQAARAGADFVGLVFHPGSPRCVSGQQAAAVAAAVKRGGAVPVAVFVDHGYLDMLRICQATAVRTVQLQGDKARAEHHLLPAEYQRIYVQNVSNQGRLQNKQGLQKLDYDRDLVLIDHKNPGQGKTIDPRFRYEGSFRWILAGGLSASNVVEAIKRFQPDGVDVSSGVESSPATKNLGLVQGFVNSVRGDDHVG